MSERLYREFLLMEAEAEQQLGSDGCVPFQYIVTTASPPHPSGCALIRSWCSS
jgi:hypothetical protein